MLPVFGTVQMAWRFVVLNFVLVLRIVALPCAAMALIDIFWEQRVAGAIRLVLDTGLQGEAALLAVYGRTWLGWVAVIAADALVIAASSAAVAGLALGQNPNAALKFGRPEIMVLAVNLLVLALLAASIALPGWIFVPLLGGENGLLVASLGVIAGVAGVCYVSARLTLVLPAAAVNLPKPFTTSWQLSHQRVWRIIGLILFALVPIVLLSLVLSSIVTAVAGGPDLVRELNALSSKGDIVSALRSQLRMTEMLGLPLAITNALMGGLTIAVVSTTAAFAWVAIRSAARPSA